jgi:hypothetical protein
MTMKNGRKDGQMICTHSTIASARHVDFHGIFVSTLRHSVRFVITDAALGTKARGLASVLVSRRRVA